MDRIAISAPVFRVFTDAITLLLVVLSTRSILHFTPNITLTAEPARSTPVGSLPSCLRTRRLAVRICINEDYMRAVLELQSLENAVNP